MATFTPPTYEARPRAYPGEPGHELWKHYDGIYTGYAVLITSGVASTHPGVATPDTDAIAAASSYFAGGRTHSITAAEKTILDAAGYTTVA